MTDFSATISVCLETQYPISLLYTEASGGVDVVTYTPVYDTVSETALVPGTSDSISSSPAPIPTHSQSPSPKSKTPIGAIVGGVVGGLAVLGGIAAGIVFICMRKGRNTGNAINAGDAAQAAPSMQYPPPQPNHMVDNRYSVPPEYPHHQQQETFYSKTPYDVVSPVSPVPQYSPPPHQPTPQPVQNMQAMSVPYQVHPSQQQQPFGSPMSHVSELPSHHAQAGAPAPGQHIYEVSG
jgi:hypothetical protein